MDLADAVEAIRRTIAAVFSGAAPFDLPDIAFGDGDLDGQLVSHRSGLFLGLYDEESATRALELRGVLPAIRARTGYGTRVRIHPDEGTLQVYRDDLPEGPEALLAEAKARVERASGGAPREVAAASGRPAGFPSGDFLVVDWILLQHPGRPFVPGRRPLPGQSHPGLGIGREVLEAATQAAKRLGAAGVIGIPMYYHTAVLYHLRLAFIDPVDEGRFLALARDLHPLRFEEAAFAVDEGRVRDATFDEPLRWVGKEMVLPLTKPVQDWLSSPAYVDAAARTLLGTRFTVEAAPAAGRRGP